MTQTAPEPNLEASIDRLYETAATKIDELIAERDSARQEAGDLRRALLDEQIRVLNFLKASDLSEFLHAVEKFLDNQADADGDVTGFTPNAALRLQVDAQRAIAALAKLEA